MDGTPKPLVAIRALIPLTRPNTVMVPRADRAQLVVAAVGVVIVSLLARETRLWDGKRPGEFLGGLLRADRMGREQAGATEPRPATREWREEIRCFEG